MRIHQGTLRFGMSLAAFAALLLLPPEYLLAQLVPLPASQAGSVTGVVRTVSGVPASGIRVTALRVDSTDDRLRAMASLSQTDSMGRYRLENVPPGRYYITAGRVDLPTYYPGTLDMTKGAVIAISSLGLTADIDFVVQDTSATAPAAPGAFGIRSGGPVVNLPNTTFIAGAFGGGYTVMNNFQVQGGPVPRSGGIGRNSGPAPPSAAAAPGQAGRGGGLSVASNSSQSGLLWWTNAALVARLALTDDQKKRIESTFEQYRQMLVQNIADLERDEAGLARMLEAEPMEPTKTISAQIERVVQSRAEMERTNSKMTLDIRQILSRAQWVQLQSETGQAGLGPATNGPAPRSATPAVGRGQRNGGAPAAPALPAPGAPGPK